MAPYDGQTGLETFDFETNLTGPDPQVLVLPTPCSRQNLSTGMPIPACFKIPNFLISPYRVFSIQNLHNQYVEKVLLMNPMVFWGFKIKIAL